MPLSRYQIRNEYSLADPELYLAADKDDPEALLEGVAMAGLVGVLRQLGDLSEFAAEIFHQLHEEVMATAARGHGLMTRVQQLESEIPSIEKAFLSQTSHSSLYYNAGLDWHANLCMDQNLITQGDLPQFVMDSYEECRGPPRLFILDKFDVAGAGSCLKRYTNPSFFKVEAAFSGAPNVEIQRDKKIRKVKKKGARKRNGETPEVLPTSTVKLHQLFLEERIENGSNDPARLVKLKKRQLNGSRFDSQTKQSYMQKLLQTSSPEHRVVHEISTSPPLNLSSNSIEPVQKILDIQTFDVESPKRSRSRSVSPIARETILQPSTGELSEEVIDGGNLKVPTLDLDNKMEDISSRLDEVVAEKEFAVDRESKAEGSVDGSSSDDLASETDNFMDALNTLESEIETDTECRPKNDLGFFNVEKHGRDSDANEEQLELQAQFSDSQSIGYSNASDVGIISLKKEASSFPYSDLSCLAENTPSDADGVAEVFPSTENRIVEYVDTSSDKLSISDEILGTKYHEKSIPNGTCTEVVEVPNPWAECGEAYGISNSTNSNPTLPSLGLGAHSGEVLSVVSEQDVTFSDNNELDTSRKNTGDILSATDNLSDIPSLKNIVPAENHPADDLDDVDSNIFTDALLNLSNDSVIAPENNRRKIGVNEVLQTGNAEDTSHKIFHSDSLVQLPSDSDPFPDEKNCRENVGDEVLQTEYADDASLESIINKNIGSPLLNVLSTEKKFLNSNLPELEPPSGITPQLNYLSASTAHCPDAENPDNIVSELVTISAAVANSEDSTPVVNTPQSSSFSEQKFSKRADDFLTPEIDSAEVGGLHSGERKDSEGVCRTKDFEEIEGSTSSEDGMESVLVSSKFSSEYPNHASPKEENMVTGTAANIPVANIDVDSDADNLSQDIPCSLSTNSISMQESLSTFGESHQKVLEIHELSPPYCLIKSDAQEEVNQPAGSGDSDSLPLGAVSCEHSNLKPPNDVPELSLNLQSLNNLPNPDATKSPISSMQISQRTEFPSGISGPSQIDKDQKVLPIHDFTSSPISSKEKEQDIGPDSLHQTNFSDDSKSAGSLPTSYLPDPGNQFEQAMELQADQLSMECVNADNTVPKISILLPEQIPDLNHIPQERCFSAFTESSLEGLPGQASMSESSLQSADIKLESSEQAMAPSASVFPSFGLFPQASQISLEEMPPLPPLPPMQWRIGKSQHPSLASARQSLQEHSLGSFPPILPSTAAENAQSGFLTSADIQQPQNPFLPPSDVKDEKSQHISEHLAGPSPFSLQIQTMVSGAYNQQSLLTLGGGTESLNPFLPLPAMPEIPQDGFLTLEGERTQLTLNPFSLEPPVETQLPAPLPENLILPPNQQALEKDLVAKKFQDTSQNLEEEKVNSLEFLPPSMVEDEQPQHGLQIPGESTWSSYASGLLPDSEKGKPNGDLLIKVPRPRNPLIDAVAAHDKSKLRKVIERARPQIEHKDDERNSLLEQIRTKSFNLKPSIVTRPSIQGPKTNLRVAAILEKANAIRQAFAGSDEDDDDNWSDS